MEATEETSGRWPTPLMVGTAISFIAVLLGIILAVTLSDKRDRMDGDQRTEDRGAIHGGLGYGPGHEDGAAGTRPEHMDERAGIDERRLPPGDAVTGDGTYPTGEARRLTPPGADRESGPLTNP
jgi:hypothetical protein